MNYTENYQLPQWVESDRVLMDDFNNAMRKIEGGILSRWGKELIKEETTNRQLSQWDIDVSSVEFSQYELIIVSYRLTGVACCGFQVNHTGGSQLAYIGMMETQPDIPGHAILFPLRSSDTIVRCLGLGYGAGFGTASITYGEIDTFTFICNDESCYIGAGSTIKVYGTK